MTIGYVAAGYVESGYNQTGISIDWGTKVIFIPKFFLTLLSGTSYSLDTNAFRIALKELEDSEEGMVFPQTHNHNTSVNLGGIEYSRIIEIINGYTITFEDGVYSVSLIGSNNNILDVANLNQVSVRANNSAGLINVSEVQVSAFDDGVTIDTTLGTAGTLYPIGTQAKPVNNITDALAIAAGRGFTNLYIIGNLTIPSGANISKFHIYGQGATLNVTQTTITLVSGATTNDTHYHECRITGYMPNESIFENCIISALTNAHCLYIRCGMIDGTALGYTIQQSSSVGSGHASYWKECFSDEGEFILDRNAGKVTTTLDGFSGNIRIKNQNGATAGLVRIHMQGGQVTLDSTCTTGTIKISGVCTVVNNSAGTTVDVTGVTASWQNTATSFNTAGTMGAKVNAAGTAGDPWGADLTGYAPGTAGALLVDTNTVVNQIDSITPTQATMLLEMYELLGLNPSKPLTVTNNSRTVTGISQVITSDQNSTVVQRV